MASQLEEERQQYAEQLEIVAASLKDDPGNGELQALKDELDQMIQMIDESLAELKPKQQQQQSAPSQHRPAPKPAAAEASPPPPPAPEKWSRENHPAFKKTTPTPAAPVEEDKEQPLINYQVNDTVMAKWVSGDKAFYQARITAVTGSSTKPMYTVKFKSYDTIETLGARDIRPVGGPAAAGQKRKADDATTTAPGSSSATPTPVTGSNGVVSAAAPTVYPQEKREGEEKPVKKFKKIKATKELEKGKSKWQEFNAKAAGKMGKHKKESMFRTPEGVGGRVGFVGSGQTMRKDPTRTRHIYQPAEDQD